MTLIHDEIAEVLKRGVLQSGAAPGASAFVARFGQAGWRSATAAAGVLSGAGSPPVNPHTIYDLASLTKPIVACTVARLVRAGVLEWDTPLGDVLPRARGTASESIALEWLASHRAGLEAHVRLRDVATDASRWLEICADARRAECRTSLPSEGFPPVYSDLGYVLLGAVLEALTARPLAEVLQRETLGPQGLEIDCAHGFCQRLGRAEFLARVAPTEAVADRGGLLRGVVHDDNAWDLAGAGVAGHAGLFGTAAAVGGFARAMLDAWAGRRDEWLTREQARFLVAPRAGGSLRAGFDGKAEAGSSAGARFGSRAFGHLGFTGTSLWCDPDADIAVVLLTNRVHPTRENIRIRNVRPAVHGELFGLAAGLVP